jgi:mono/diheme cytochrome c family protein
MRFYTKIVLSSLLFIATLFSSASFVVAGEGAKKQPNVPFKFAIGKKKYQQMCSVCHGEWLGGSKMGPPLMHGFYKPSHHGDPAFYRAAMKGVQAHHWKFGNMAPVNGITRKDMDSIVPFIRWLQKEKGLY